jgi:CheY-like chemotaxis protein
VANILVIEDDVPLQEAYSFILKTAGHRVTSAYNGKEGLSLVEKHTYDVILLDIHMPVMDGWQFLKKYNKLPSSGATIIVFSNMIEPEIKKRAADLGAYQSVLKSAMTPAGMLELIKEVAAHKRTETQDTAV